ncbi:MAG: methenyltetrahydrofolate cyclohydrolase [Thermoplasmata archaeon M11B2D]|nr:MAG: methenyltetrahydrofolate cyclohydrolase [Thermoplasmata archaeon M11B2D]PNX53614.1 MAG: methenyltetrahydrofolate cyclohydrolase [Thermoplasmata archaeon M9B2D]
MTKLVNQTVGLFLDELASNSPAPGGGSVAALSGAVGAALSSMVSNLTKGKQGYEPVQDDITELLEKSENLRKELTDLIDKDTEAFNKVMSALKMPKETDEQKEKRKNALQIAFKHAAEVPLETAQKCAQVIEIACVIAQKGNKNSISDAAVSAVMSRAGVQAAILNVRINLGSIKDPAYVQQRSTQLEELWNHATEKSAEVLAIVEKTL